jgi:TRAP-type C4-dicarboxylate transport system permease small subunit
MDEKTRSVIEICCGLIMVGVGILVYWWSKQLVWIAIYPPPLAKQIIEVLPVIFWFVSMILLVDGSIRLILHWKSERENPTI